MLIFNTNLCYLCSQLLVSHRSISFFLFPIIRIHFTLCNRFWPVYSFFPFCFEKFNKLQLKLPVFFLLHFCNIYYTMRNQDSWLLLFTGNVPRGVFANKVHRKNEKCGAKSYKTWFLCIQKDITVNVRNRYYSTINFIWFCLKKQPICDKWLVFVTIRHRYYLICSK